jgi:hypothetical protein
MSLESSGLEQAIQRTYNVLADNKLLLQSLTKGVAARCHPPCKCRLIKGLISKHAEAWQQLSCWGCEKVDLDMARLLPEITAALWGNGHEASIMHEVLDHYNL